MLLICKIILVVFLLSIDEIRKPTEYRRNAIVSAQYHTQGYPVASKICPNTKCGITVANLVNNVSPVNDPDKYPFLVSLVRKERREHLCGGMIITQNVILTAGHCAQRTEMKQSPQCKGSRTPANCYFEPHELQVKVTDATNSVRHVDVQRVIPHPNFSAGTFVHDISLIQLRTPLPCNIIPICLPNERLSQPGSILRIAGRGRDPSINGQNHSQCVMDGEIRQIDSNTCPYPESADRFINCVIGTGKCQSSCQGDSGSALFGKFDEHYVALGISSVGPANCDLYKPTPYSDIVSYMRWIRSYVRILPGAS